MSPVQPGTLLVAHPMLADANFRRSVVLICEHGPDGSFGLILNKPLALELSEVVDDLDSKLAVSLGGPVDPNTLHYVHRHGDLLLNSVPVTEDIYWGGDFDITKALITSDESYADAVRFFLGYSGWEAGQLEAEIEEGGWILTTVEDPALVFPADAEQLWRTVLRRMGGDYALLANFPDDPRMN